MSIYYRKWLKELVDRNQAPTKAYDDEWTDERMDALTKKIEGLSEAEGGIEYDA